MIFLQQRKEAGPGVLAVTVTPTGFRLLESASNLDFVFDASQLQHGADVLYLCRAADGRVCRVWASERNASRDGHAYALSRQNLLRFEPFAVIAIEPGLRCHLLVPGPASTVVSDAVDAAAGDALAVMADAVPAVRVILAQLVAKRALISQISTQDSLAALEAQLDMLMHIVGAPWRQPLVCFTDEEMAQHRAFFEAMASRSSVRDVAVATVKVSAFKSRLRALQAVYFKATGRG